MNIVFVVSTADHNVAQAISCNNSSFRAVFVAPYIRDIDLAQAIRKEIPSERPIVTDYLLGQQDGLRNKRLPRIQLEKWFPEVLFALYPTTYRDSDTPEQLKYFVSRTIGLAREMGSENTLIVAPRDTINSWLSSPLEGDWVTVNI